MNLSEPFIQRPVATSLLTAAVVLGGIIAFRLLPVSPLPQVEYPTIQVTASLPGASPETMASSVATPLERQFGRIAGLTEMTSTSYLGSTLIVLQFDLSRNIDAAARDVQAAINAARTYLPANLPSSPLYRKVNPADAPILILALTSDTVDQATVYDVASSVLQQKLSQVSGVGQVFAGGSSLPAVRVELNPTVVNRFGIGLDQVRTFLGTANANRPKGQVENGDQAYELQTTDQLLKASQYRPLVVAYQNGAPVRLADLGEVDDSVEDLRNAGLADGKPAVLLVIFRQPGANVIDTVDRVKAMLPELKASVPAAVNLGVMIDLSITIRASVRDMEYTLLVSIGLVVLVVFLFLRNGWATLIPSVVAPLALLGAVGIMYLAGYSLDNLSLMALAISTGFVVDDAIVVIENIARYLEQGLAPYAAALRGAREIGFAVLSMSTSLVAVFIPILLMGGIVGRLFREFAVTLSATILVSMVVSLTTTPMMSARFLRRQTGHGWFYRTGETVFDWIRNLYAASLRAVLRHTPLTLAVFLSTVALTVYLYAIVPKGFFPEQDTGRMMGIVQARQDISFQAMRQKVAYFVEAVRSDPAVAHVVAFTGGSGGSNMGRMFVSLKDLSVRKVGVETVMARIRHKTANVPGAALYMQPIQDIRVGGRLTGAEYQYTLTSQDLPLLTTWGPRILARLRTMRMLTDVNSDLENDGLAARILLDRDTASRLQISVQAIDNALYDAFGQRQVSTMYTALNQYHVVMEVAPQYWQSPDTLKITYVREPVIAPSSALNQPTGSSLLIQPAGASGVTRPAGTSVVNQPAGSSPVTQPIGSSLLAQPSVSPVPPVAGGNEIPLSTIARFGPSTTPIVVNHQGQFPSVTISFNLRPGVSLGDAVNIIGEATSGMGMPAAIHSGFAGTAEAFQASLANEPGLIAMALIAVYIVLGVLYESFVHPLTILSTLPSAGAGALFALLLFHVELSVIALIGILLLIGIVTKNAILMIDFALEGERRGGMTSREAIYQACLLRFRPIIMTTMAALLGALPLALGSGTGSELRRPLGISIVGGLIVSQMQTLFTTPVVYLYLDRARLWFLHRRGSVPAEARPAAW
jgi:multidrug efflux pump